MVSILFLSTGGVVVQSFSVTFFFKRGTTMDNTIPEPILIEAGTPAVSIRHCLIVS